MMKPRRISKERKSNGNRIKAAVMMVLAIIVAVGFVMYAFSSDSVGYSVVLVLVAALLLVIFGVFALGRYKDAVKGLPFEDERRRSVMEKAAAKSFYVMLYVLLGMGMLSDGVILFMDVSQATSTAVGIMALLWFVFWVYYSRKES